MENIEYFDEELGKEKEEIESENDNWCIYKHTNIENGKTYYGIAIDCNNRWKQGLGYTTNPKFWRDIILYGWKNFTHEIICKDLSKIQALWLEGLLIQETRTYEDCYGYNTNYHHIDFENVIDFVEEETQCMGFRPVSSTSQSPQRRGRGGTPVVYKEKYYSNIKSLALEIDEDETMIAQSLNPNSPRVMPKYLKDNGLRYATELEITENS